MTVSRILITLGFILLIAGLSVSFFEDKFKWFGNMPLDLNFKNKTMRVFAPFGSMIMISILLTVVLDLILQTHF